MTKGPVDTVGNVEEGGAGGDRALVDRAYPLLPFYRKGIR